MVELSEIHHAEDRAVADRIVPLRLEDVIDGRRREIVEVADRAFLLARIDMLVRRDGWPPVLVDHQVMQRAELTEQFSIVRARIAAETRHTETHRQHDVILRTTRIDDSVW